MNVGGVLTAVSKTARGLRLDANLISINLISEQQSFPMFGFNEIFSLASFIPSEGGKIFHKTLWLGTNVASFFFYTCFAARA